MNKFEHSWPRSFESLKRAEMVLCSLFQSLTGNWKTTLQWNYILPCAFFKRKTECLMYCAFLRMDQILLSVKEEFQFFLKITPGIQSAITVDGVQQWQWSFLVFLFKRKGFFFISSPLPFNHWLHTDLAVYKALSCFYIKWRERFNISGLSAILQYTVSPIF